MTNRMSPADAAALLAVAAAYDNRHLSPEAAVVWADALAGLRPEDCRQAIVDHYATSTAFIMPGHVRAAVHRLRVDRLDRAGDLVIDHDPDDAAGYIAATKAARRAVADGNPPPAAPALPPAAVAARRAEFAARMSRVLAATRVPPAEPEDPARARALARARTEPRRPAPQMTRAEQMACLQQRIDREEETSDAR